MPAVGDHVCFVDEKGVPRSALLQCVHGNDYKNATSDTCVNLVFISGDEKREDSYGRQIEHRTSVPHKEHQSAHGMYWEEV